MRAAITDRHMLTGWLRARPLPPEARCRRLTRTAPSDPVRPDDWWRGPESADGDVVGFANVAWDGGDLTRQPGFAGGSGSSLLRRWFAQDRLVDREDVA